MGILKSALVTMLVIASSGCSAGRPRTIVACQSNDVSVMRAALENEKRTSGDERLLLFDATYLPAQSIPEWKSDHVLLSSLRDRNLEGEAIDHSIGLSFVSIENSNALLRLIDEPKGKEWVEFYRKHSRGTSVVSLSVPGYDTNGCSALIYVARSAGVLDTEGSLLWLKWKDGRWLVRRRESLLAE